MKKTSLSLALLAFSFALYAQVTELPVEAVPASSDEMAPMTPDQAASKERTLEIFDVEVLPEFPGGEEAMYKYIGENLIYPKDAKKNAIQGVVVATFIIDRDGSVTDVVLVRDIGAGCGEAAVNLIKSMPRWVPGQILGKPVRVRYTLPFRFKLD